MAVFKVDTDALSNLSKSVSDQKQTIEGLSKKYTTLTSHTNKIIDNGPYAIPNAGTVQNTNEAINTGHTNVVKHYSQTIENISSIVIQAKIADFLATSFPPSLDSLNPLKVIKDFISDKLGGVFDNKGKTKEEKLAEEIFENITPQEYAMLSHLSYKSPKTIEDGLINYGLDKKFEIETIDGKKVTSYKSGLEAVVFTNVKTGEHIVAFRGTEMTSLEDLQEDMNGVAGVNIKVKNFYEKPLGEFLRVPPAMSFLPSVKMERITQSKQYPDAVEFMNKVEEKLDSTGNISFTGHSLGGWVALAMADRMKRPGVTFNAPGFFKQSKFSEGSKGKYLKNGYQKSINFRTDTDIISMKNDFTRMSYSPGLNLSVPNVGSSVLTPHGIKDNFQFDNKGNVLINEGQGSLKGTGYIDSSKISVETAIELTSPARYYGPHFESKEELIKKLDQGIEHYSQLVEFKSLGGEYAQASDQKEFVNDIKKDIKQINDDIKAVEKEISDLKERTNKTVKEVEELWEESHAPQASMLHSVYGEGGDYVARQEKKIDKLRNQLEDLNAMKEVLKMEEERGYKGKDMEVLERMVKFKTALD